jgi:hypothetical protein
MEEFCPEVSVRSGLQSQHPDYGPGRAVDRTWAFRVEDPIVPLSKSAEQTIVRESILNSIEPGPARDVFVVLPSGEFEPVPKSVTYEEKDVYEIREIHPLVKEAVEEGIKFPEQLDFYMDCRMNGESRKMAAMFATRSFPGLKTDSIFNEGRFSGDSGRISVEQQWLRAKAEEAGVSTAGKYYMRGLADFPGDPTAWVSDRSDVLRIAKAKNMTVHGYVEHQAREVEPTPDVPLADDIVEREVDEVMSYGLNIPREQLREEAFANRSGAVDNHDLLVGNYDESYLQPGA